MNGQVRGLPPFVRPDRNLISLASKSTWPHSIFFSSPGACTPRAKADHLSVLIGGYDDRLVPVERLQAPQESAARPALEIVDPHHRRKMTGDDQVVRQLLPAQRTHTSVRLRIAGRDAYDDELCGRTVLPDERGIGGAG